MIELLQIAHDTLPILNFILLAKLVINSNFMIKEHKKHGKY